MAHLLNDDVKMFELVERTIALEVPLNNWAYLKKLVGINKHTNAFVSLLVVNELLKHKQEANSKDLE